MKCYFKRWTGKILVWYILSMSKNTKRHTAHTIVSWPNPKQWVIVHTSDLMMIIRQSIYIYIFIYITCVFILLYSEGTGAEMDSIHIYFETRVLSVSHTMIDNVPNSSNCVILLLPYHERAIKWKISWSAVSWMMACCLTASSHYPCRYWLEIISIHPS